MDEIKQLYDLYLKTPRAFTDSRTASQGGIFFALKGDHFDGNNFATAAIADGANLAVVDRKELAREKACFYVKDSLKTLQLLANYHRRQLKIPFIGITGSNGKTTTKELLHAVLKEKYKVIATAGNYNNHIGVPLTLLNVNTEHEIAIVEMGANHPEEIAFLCTIAEPEYGLITNVGKAHLEGFGSFEGVKKTKGELYDFIARSGKGIFINTNNKHLQEMSTNNSVKFTYGSANDSDLVGELAGESIYTTAKVRFPKGWLYLRSKLTGNYNLENILAAARVGLFFDVDPLDIQKGIEAYFPKNNRSQLVKLKDSEFLLDCYNANPTSMEAALENFFEIKKENKALILGDMLELGSDSVVEHQRIVDLIQSAGTKETVLLGDEFMKTQTPDAFRKYTTVNDFLKNTPSDWFDNKFLLIKGSRGMKLETILDNI